MGMIVTTTWVPAMALGGSLIDRLQGSRSGLCLSAFLQVASARLEGRERRCETAPNPSLVPHEPAWVTG